LRISTWFTTPIGSCLSFRRLLPLLPANVHLMITCPAGTGSFMAGLRSKQTLRVLEETELAFNLEEVNALFRNLWTR